MIFHGKHVDRFTILKHTGLKFPQNSNTFNDVSKCINNPNNPVVLFPSSWKQCLPPLTLRVRISLRRGVFDTTLCDKDCQ